MSQILARIQSLDPRRDCFEIVRLSTGYHFPHDSYWALELAFFRTFAVPSMACLLDQTGEFKNRAQKRHDDTVLLVSELIEQGLETARGQAALARMNAIHARFHIGQDDYRYVLSTFVMEPLRWNARFGWRPLLEQEKEAAFQVWSQIGTGMGISPSFESLQALTQFNRQYELERFRYTEAAHRLATATLELLVSWYPRSLAPLVRQAVYALLDAPVRQAFGFPEPHPAVAATLPRVLERLGRARRFLPERRSPLLRAGRRVPSYPQGYVIETLGPPGTPRQELQHESSTPL